MAMTAHFSSAKRYSDVDAKSSALLRAQASIKAYRRTDSSQNSELWSTQDRSAAIQSSTDGLGGEDLGEWDYGEQLTSQKVSLESEMEFEEGALRLTGVRHADSAAAGGAVVLEDVSLQEKGREGKKKGYFARKLRRS